MTEVIHPVNRTVSRENSTTRQAPEPWRLRTTKALSSTAGKEVKALDTIPSKSVGLPYGVDTFILVRWCVFASGNVVPSTLQLSRPGGAMHWE